MEILISAHNLKKQYGVRPLFLGITFAIEERERVGLIGPNGAGKSSLLHILAGHSSPDEGSISKKRGLRVGFLEQTPKFKPGQNILDTILGENGYDDWETQSTAHEIMSKLSLEDGPVDSLSGGWKKRVALARELVKKPDLLLLDEPTNHLDVESILWLENLLAESQFATITVTHDRLFLQRVSNRILELDKRNVGGLLSVRGDYSAYLETKEQLMAGQERREIVLKNTLRRETEWLRRGAKARTTKQQGRIKRAGELKEEVEELQVRNQSRVANLDFQEAEKNPKRLVDAKGISKTLGGKTLFKNIDLLLSPGTRIGLLGPNGCGKSTLIRVLLDNEKSDTGEVRRSDNLTVSYFEQNRDVLDPDISITETLCPKGDTVDFRGGRIHIKSYLDRFLFTKEQMDMKVRHMSGGEQSRLLIAKLMLNTANLLVLDEPTNDLDMATLNVLEECLTEFNGAVLFVTHDRYFLDQVATRILAFDGNSNLIAFAGIEQWESWKIDQELKEKSAAASPKKAAVTSTPVVAPAVSTPPMKAKKLSNKEQQELKTMEETIQKLEAELEKLTFQSADPEMLREPKKLLEITSAMGKAQQEIDRLYARWSELDTIAKA